VGSKENRLLRLLDLPTKPQHRYLHQHNIFQDSDNKGKIKSSRNRRKQNPTFWKKSKIFFQEQVHTEPAALAGGRNLVGGTRIVSKKNIE
jgi:hypothetical protein